MSSDAPRKPSSSTNPLGGPAKHRFRQVILRQWSGYVALVRVCPACGHENRETDLFCTGCARNLRDEPIQSSQDDRAGVDLLNRRLAREERHRSRSRAHLAQGGGGWIFVGLVLVMISIVMQAEPFVRLLFWLGGIGLGIVGIWQIRRDGSTLRVWGYILTSIAASFLVLITVRALAGEEITADPDVSLNQAATPEPGIGPIPGASGTPPAANGITGEVAMYRGGPRHDGQLAGPAPANAPKLTWRFDTGGEVYSSPAIANGTLYVASKDGILYALDAASGTEQWRFRISEYVTRSSPAVIDGTVYIGGGFAFYAIDAATGQQQWSVPIRYAGQASPTVANGVVIVTSQEGWIYALKVGT
ncbi:MAG: PQQ-binding-like beta-propeller repeat protein, partial [Chloroflexota bacterium]|nr:PQQ-binding-like beta-propeller repeat protein [Chloroflexota bacterium]